MIVNKMSASLTDRNGKHNKTLDIRHDASITGLDIEFNIRYLDGKWDEGLVQFYLADDGSLMLKFAPYNENGVLPEYDIKLSPPK